MQALWVSLKDNANCGCKHSDVVVTRHQNCNVQSRCNAYNQTFDGKFITQMRKSFTEVIGKPQYPHTHFSELTVGDPTRNIVEMIFQRASANPSKLERKIKRVLRVNHTTEILERFEGYREQVKENAYETHKGHPRNRVDGNELLRFYGATMSCRRDKTTQVSELCRDPLCRVCRIIQAKFATEHAKKNGIRLSRNSEELIDNVAAAFRRVKKMERAVIVCRIIAGSVVTKVDRPCENSELIGSKGKQSHSETLIVRNPCAILPCFVVVFD